MTRVGGTQQAFSDSVSVGLRGQIGDTPRTDLIVEDDETVLEVCRQIVLAASEDSIGVQSVSIDIDQDPLRLPLILAQYASRGLTEQTPLLLAWTHPSKTAVFNDALMIDGFSHNLTMQGNQAKWTCTMLTSRLVPQATEMVWDVNFWDDGSVWAFTP
jgi:hypothetical protein